MIKWIYERGDEAYAAEGLAAMTKRLLILFMALGFIVHSAGCSSGGPRDESEVSELNDESFAEEGEGDFLDSEGDEFAESSDESDEFADEGEFSDEGEFAEGSDEEFSDDMSLDDEEQLADAGEPMDADGEEELSLDDSLEEGLPEDIASTEPPLEPESQSPPPSDEPLFTGEPEPVNEDPLFADSQPSDEFGSGAPVDSFSETTPSNPSTSESSFAEAEPSPFSSDTDATPAVSWVPVKKIRDSAFTKSGANLNRVYIARPGDNLASISQKVYGDQSRERDLARWNSTLKNGVKTGDKVYYTSPVNPTDPSMMTYYEDLGIPASIYVSKEGDNIRRASKNLLGSSDSWKEVWATNMNVESKGDIPSGVELRYWPEGVDAGVTAISGMPSGEMIGSGPSGGLESMMPNPSQTPSEIPPLGGDPDSALPFEDPMTPPMDPMEPMDPGAVAMNDPLANPPPMDPPPPPPPPPLGGSTGTVDQSNLPPQDPLVPPPPPVEAQPVQKRPSKQAMSDDLASDPDTLMLIGGGGVILLAAVVLFVMIRKNRSKRIDLGQTQV